MSFTIFHRYGTIQFLRYDPKDIIIVIDGFIFGPVTSFAMTVIVFIVQMFTVSGTGILGCIMNIISSCSFACIDYILKGIEPVEDKEQKSKELYSKVLYVASTAFVFIGLFCAFGGWYEDRTLGVVWGSMIIQAVGIACYFIGKLLSKERAPFYVEWLNIVGIAYMPISMMTGFISMLVFRNGWIAPYLVEIFHILVFGIVFSVIVVVSYLFVKKRTHSTQ